MPVTPPEAVREAVAVAEQAQAGWGRAPFAERSRLLRAVRTELLAAADEIASTIVAETGKPIVEAHTSELFVSLDHAAWLARHGPRVLRGERVPLREPYLLHKRGRLRYEPVGVVGIVSPWNFPLGVPFTQVATAVAAGNAVVVKPSELTPSPAPGSRSSSAAPVPQGSSAWCRGRVPQRAALSSVTRASGARVHRLDRRRPHRRGAGGRAARARHAGARRQGPDARPRRRRSRARRRRRLVGAFTNCGQVCSGIERVYVEGPLYEPFLERLSARARSLRIGPGDAPDVELGPLVTEGQRSRVEALVAEALERGASLVSGGGRPPRRVFPGGSTSRPCSPGEPAGARIERERSSVQWSPLPG